MIYRALAILCLIWVQQSWSDQNVPEKANIVGYSPYVRELLANTEYELVDIEFSKLRQRRWTMKDEDIKHMRIRAFGENIELWLHPIDANLINDRTSLYYASYNEKFSGNVAIRRDESNVTLKMVGIILEDPAHLATMVISNDNHGKITVNGQIHSKNLGIVSLSDPVNRMAMDQPNLDGISLSQNHAIYKLPPSNDQTEDYTPNDTVQEIYDIEVRRDFTYPRALYPEILMVVDWTMYRNVMSVIRFMEYIMAFVNGVDLKFRSWKTPRMRLRISGILVPVNPRAIPYITTNKIDKHTFNYSKALDGSANFFNLIKDQIPLESYDLAITITKLKFGLGEDGTVRGSSFTGTVCESKSNGMYSSAIVRDNGVFSGIFTAAHELGHLLGLYHDTPDNCNCRNTRGYIMNAYPYFNRHSVLFSPCSLRNITEYLRSGKLSCLYNKPKSYGNKLPHLMPGKMANRHKQCRAYNYRYACNYNTDQFCLHLYCRGPNGTCTHVSEQTLEGTRCSEKNARPAKFCVNGKCIRRRN